MDDSFTIEALCLFCNTALTSEEGEESHSGDLIKCNNCGELNDYDSVVEVAKEKGVEKVKTEMEKELSKTMKNLFK